jgi:hypothetical protein
MEKKKYAPGKHPNSLVNLKKGGWKPGQSGNPEGRPKGIKYVSEALREQLGNEALADELAKKLVERAKKSDSALSIILDRTEGKVTLPIGGDPNMPIVVERIVAHVTEEKNGSGSSKSDSKATDS